MGVQFQDEQNMPQRQFQSKQKVTFAQRLVNWGVASSVATANKILVGVAIAAAVLAVGIWIFTAGSGGGEDLRSEFPPGSSTL